MKSSWFVLACLAFGIATTQVLPAQTSDTWKPIVEVGATLGGTWLDATSSPKVSSSPGIFASAGVQRRMSSRATVGALLRVGTSSVRLAEHGDKWDGGRVLESDLLVTASAHSAKRPDARTSLDAGAGVALINAPDDILPFSATSSVAPVGEIGVSVGTRRSESRRTDVALLVRYSILYLRSSELRATSGAVSRIIAGVRVSR